MLGFGYDYHISFFSTKQLPELGRRQLCRENVTVFSGLKVVGYCIIPLFVVATPIRKQSYLNFLRIYSRP